MQFQSLAPRPITLEALPTPRVLSIDSEYNTNGHAPLKVLCEDDKFYVAKNAGSHVPPCFIISEFLGHFLLRLWGLHTPHAAVIYLSPDYVDEYKALQPSKLSRRQIPRHYARPCFGSRFIPNTVEVGPIHQTQRTDSWRRIDNFFDLLLLTLFDIWTENDDRKPGNPNLLLMPVSERRFRWTAIDHAFCFGSINYDQLMPDYVSMSFNDSLLVAPMLAGLKRLVCKTPGWDAVVTQAFYLRVQACQAAFSHLCSLVPAELGFTPSLQTNVADFLFDKDRNQQVLQMYFAHFL